MVPRYITRDWERPVETPETRSGSQIAIHRWRLQRLGETSGDSGDHSTNLYTSRMMKKIIASRIYKLIAFKNVRQEGTNGHTIYFQHMINEVDKPVPHRYMLDFLSAFNNSDNVTQYT